jgi:DNA-binding transcriptional regulator YiaG
MTPSQYKSAIETLGLSQERAGDWLGVGRRTSQGWAIGEYPVPEPVAKLLRLMVRLKLSPEDVK